MCIFSYQKHAGRYLFMFKQSIYWKNIKTFSSQVNCDSTSWLKHVFFIFLLKWRCIHLSITCWLQLQLLMSSDSSALVECVQSYLLVYNLSFSSAASSGGVSCVILENCILCNPTALPLFCRSCLICRCVVGGCSNESYSSSDWSKVIALHRFPKPTERHLWNAWRSFVRQRREKTWEPTSSSRVCSRHFTDDCFANKTKYLLSVDNSSLKCA